MPDGSFGARDIFLDLNATPAARVIRDATKNHWVKIRGIRINGVAGASAGDIILHGEGAAGPTIFTLLAAASSPHDGTFFVHGNPIIKGLYMESVGTAWLAGATMVIHTA